MDKWHLGMQGRLGGAKRCSLMFVLSQVTQNVSPARMDGYLMHCDTFWVVLEVETSRHVW